MRQNGFSLIEMLVVVVIIGILGAVGILGYQAYISQTRDATTKDNFEFLKRTLDQDIVSVSNELGARSKFSEGLTKASACYQLRDKYIFDMNLKRSNPFNSEKGQVCDGNHYMTHVLQTDPTRTWLEIGRGQTMVFCTGTSIQNASLKTVSNKLGLKFCTCTGKDVCRTTERFQAKLQDNATAGATPTIKLKDYNLPNAVGRLSRLLVGDEIVDIDLGTYDNSTVVHTVDVKNLRSNYPVDTAVLEVNANYCFTPLGETSSLANYREDFSDLGDNNTQIDGRHRCY